MSLLNSASLVVTPNGYKEGTLYSVIPNTTLGDMTVVRATTATRVNSAGLIELVPYNLMTYSEQFDNAAWTKARGLVTANATIAPNGTTTADKFVPDTQVNPHFVSQNASNLTVGGVYTSSVYAKISEWNSVAIFRNDSAVGVSFRLDTQVATVIVGSPISYSITSVGNGWFRLDVCFTAASASDGLQIRVGNNSSYSLAGNNSDGLFLWGAQIVEGTLPKDYLRTETRLNIPRLDYSNGSCPSLLVEPQRSNLFTYSEQFDNAVWNKSNTTISANATTSPSGITDADSLVPNTTNAAHFIENSNYLNLSIGQTYTTSFYAKANGYNFIQFTADGGDISGNPRVNFNLSNGTLGSVDAGITASIQDVGNGWYRCIATYVAAYNVFNNIICVINSSTAARAEAFIGNGTSGISIWGAQLELGTYPTSYIPTTSAAVTRNADAIYKTGISSLIGQTEGVVFIDFVWNQLTGTGSYPRIIELGNNSNNYIQLYSIAGTTSWGWDIYNGGVVQFSGSSTMALGHNKIAIGYKLNDMVIYKNGTLIASDATCTVPATNGLGICGTFDGTAGAQLSASVNLAVLFPTRLTNAELAQLTTI